MVQSNTVRKIKRETIKKERAREAEDSEPVKLSTKTRVGRRENIIDFLREPQVRSRSTWTLQEGRVDEISEAMSLAN